MTSRWNHRPPLARMCSAAIISVAAIVAATACGSTTGALDQYTESEAIVRGSIRTTAGAPVPDARIELTAGTSTGLCTGGVGDNTFQSSGITSADGTFLVSTHVAPVGETAACVVVHVTPPRTLGLVDTTLPGIGVRMRGRRPGTTLDTVTIAVVLRKP